MNTTIEQRHRDRVNLYYKRFANKIRIINRNRYRAKVGIPLNAPLNKKGRPIDII